MIKTIVFDIGNVVWNYESPCQRFHDNLASLLNLTPQVYKQEYLHVYHQFETNHRTLLSWCQTFNPKIDQLQLDSLLSCFLSPDIIQKYLNHDVVGLIKNLKKTNTVGYLSNGENYFIPYVYHPLDPFFHFGIVSAQVGLRKPNPLIYQEIFKHVDCKPNEVVFIDDKPENITGSKNLNINALLFTGYNQLLKDLSLYLPKNILLNAPTPTAHTK